MIIGASSYVGAYIYTELNKISEYDVIGTYHSNKLFPELIKLDITNQDEVYEVLQQSKPDIVIHMAAKANILYCENNREEARHINVKATYNISNACNRFECKLFFMSSYAALFPTSVYGKTKLEAEKIVQFTSMGFIILRPSVIIGHSPNKDKDRPFNNLIYSIKNNPAVYGDTSWSFQITGLNHIVDVIVDIIKRDIINEVIEVASPQIINKYIYSCDIAKQYKGSRVVQIDNEYKFPTFYSNLYFLKQLKLPQYEYIQIIKHIIENE